MGRRTAGRTERTGRTDKQYAPYRRPWRCAAAGRDLGARAGAAIAPEARRTVKNMTFPAGLMTKHDIS